MDQYSLPRPMAGFGGHSNPPPNNNPSGSSSQPAYISPPHQASSTVPSFQGQQHVQQNPDEVAMEEDKAPSSGQSSDSSDGELETLHLIRKRGSDGQFKVNAEANDAICEIAQAAHKDPNFKLSDVDFSSFGQKVIDVDFDARSILFESQKELASLISLTSESSSGHGTMSSSASAYSFGSVGVPTVKSETYMKLKRKLEIVKIGGEYNDMLRLKDELEVEMTKLQEEQARQSNIYAGLHIGN